MVEVGRPAREVGRPARFLSNAMSIMFSVEEVLIYSGTDFVGEDVI